MRGLKNLLLLFKKPTEGWAPSKKGVNQEVSIREPETLTQEQEEEYAQDDRNRSDHF